jgi:hypothetical protein
MPDTRFGPADAPDARPRQPPQPPALPGDRTLLDGRGAPDHTQPVLAQRLDIPIEACPPAEPGATGVRRPGRV